MNMKRALLGIAAMVVFFAAGNLHAQTLGMAGSGSSALWLELGQASATAAGCVWTEAKGSSGSPMDLEVQDTRPSTAVLEQGNLWVTWNPGTTGTCAAPAGGTITVNFLYNLDSVIGNRCFFANPACSIKVNANPTGVAGGNKVTGFTDTALPASIEAVVAAASMNTAATDIRPEDAKFASLRMFTPCGNPIVTGSQYIGLGYQTGTAGVGTSVAENPIAGSSSFHVLDFNLMGSDPITGNSLTGAYTVTEVGAQPIIVFVNPGDSGGFGSLLVQNVNRGDLAGFLDGSLGRTLDLVPGYSAANPASEVFVREPLSGTYNTMEYAIPNSAEMQTSQDLGLAALNANLDSPGTTVPAVYCSAIGGTFTAANANPLNETPSSLNLSSRAPASGATAGRFRAIGTGDEVAAVLANKDSLGYSFWSAANFANATGANAKYLTVDGVDPLFEDWEDGEIPATTAALSNVTLQHVKDGSYPIWSILRLVTANSGAGFNAVTALEASVNKFVGPTQPDFVPISTLPIVRSHFSPPGAGTLFNYPCNTNLNGGAENTPSNGSKLTVETPGCGGDVGGVVYSLQADADYASDSGNAVGLVGRRQ